MSEQGGQPSFSVVSTASEITGKLKGKFYNFGLETPVVGDYVKVLPTNM